MKRLWNLHMRRLPWSRLTVGSALSVMKLAAATFLMLAIVPAWSFAQTRAECNKCCHDIFSDDYYVEQCKLKCFRDSNHCSALRASKQSQGRPSEPAQRPPVERQTAKPESHPTAKPETATPHESAPPRAGRPAPSQQPFVWPETLVLNPGREWEAAGQILAANGIPPQHPNYTPAMKAIEQVLIDFARMNPGGGELPTDRLERIIRQVRR